MKMMHCAILIVVFSVQTAGISAVPVIEDGVLVDGIEGILKKSPDADMWRFIPDEPIPVTEKISYPAGEPLEMLPCSVLEQMTGLAGEDTQIRVQLWALFTEYKHSNFLYSVYFLPLQEEQTSPTESQESEDTSDKEQTPPAQEDSIIPSEILKQIKSNRAPDLKKFQQVAAVTGDAHLIGRSGYLTETGQLRKFEPDALGLKLDSRQFLLLPNAMLAEAQKQMARVPGKQRYNVSGLVTQYKGKTYMLLRRAERTYSHGNFRN